MNRPVRRAWTLVVVGVIALVLVSWLNRPAKWRPMLLIDASLAAEVSKRLDPGAQYELVLELRDALPQDIVREFTARRPQSLVDGGWQFLCDGMQVTAGESRDYLRILSKRSSLGKLRRVATRAPFAQDEASYRTFGLRGEFLVARVIGAFHVPVTSSGDCTLKWTAVSVDAPARVAVRQNEKTWRHHKQRYAVLAIVGELLIAAGLSMELLGVMRRRHAAVPSSPGDR